MNMQQMMAQAQRMQRELKKAIQELHEKEFTCSKGGMVTVTMKGSKEVLSIKVDEDAFEKENKDMVEDTIRMAVNELIGQIDNEEAKINERVTGQAGGFGF